MLSIRLARGGAKKRPFYRIVVAEHSRARDGKHIEVLGTSNPVASGGEQALTLKKDRYDYWCGQGAQPSACVKKLHRQFCRAQKTDAAKTAA